jgi:hypothetical protein
MRELILNLINDNSFYNERAIELVRYKEKLYIVADLHNNKIVEFNTTIYGAEFTVKHDIVNYLHWSNWNVSEIIEVVSPLQIFEFSAYEINGYITEEKSA